MRSETIFRALRKSEYVLRNWHRYCDMRWSPPLGFDYGDRKREQCKVFERELFRRLDERDTMQRELAEARAFISTVIDAPKDYPAEEGM